MLTIAAGILLALVILLVLGAIWNVSATFTVGNASRRVTHPLFARTTSYETVAV